MRATIRLFVSLAAFAAFILAGCGGGGGGGASASTGITATANTAAQNLTVGTLMTSFAPLTASGGATPYTYSYTGTLPAGLNFSTSAGTVTGTPTAVYATASLVFSVKDANNVVASTTSTVSFTVSAPANISAVATTTPQNLIVGRPMTSFTPLTASGGATPYTFSHTGTLPAGLSFSTTTGVVSGTPSAAHAAVNVIFSVKDANNFVASTTSTVSFTVVTPGATVTDVNILSTTNQSNVPIAFGQVFIDGDFVAASNSLVGDLSGTSVPLQVNVKATYPDGSVKHAVISAVVASLPSGTNTMSLTKTSPATNTPATPAALLSAGFTASVSLTLPDGVYTASADSLLAGSVNQWLGGSIANEWVVSAPLYKGATPHPHLTAQFAVRAYGTSKAKVDVTIENTSSYLANPQDYVYDASIDVGGSTVYTLTNMKHYIQARWHKQFWWVNGGGAAPDVDVEINRPYLIASKAVPNYDQTIAPTAAIATSSALWSTRTTKTNYQLGYSYSDTTDTNKATDPLGVGLLSSYMANTGGRWDIGPTNGWFATYLLSGGESLADQKTIKAIVLATGDLAGSWGIHYRDEGTGRPLSIADYPNATCCQGSNYTTGYHVPQCTSGGDCTAPTTPDTAHTPELAYIPYLITGDYYYLEEMQFWANYRLLWANAPYRSTSTGIVSSLQTRGQAWALRDLGEVAYITPDSGFGSEMKSYFNTILAANLTFYTNNYATANPNSLGIIDGSVLGDNPRSFIMYSSAGGPNWNEMPPWEDDFFTWSVGYLNELGFANTSSLLAWKSKFPIGRMGAIASDPYCYVGASMHYIVTRAASASAALADGATYSTFANVYNGTYGFLTGTPGLYTDASCGSIAQATWITNNAAVWTAAGYNSEGTVITGQMVGYAASAEGYPANMQPALAVIDNAGNAAAIPLAATAWAIFEARTAKPVYSNEPEWAIVPR